MPHQPGLLPGRGGSPCLLGPRVHQVPLGRGCSDPLRFWGGHGWSLKRGWGERVLVGCRAVPASVRDLLCDLGQALQPPWSDIGNNSSLSVDFTGPGEVRTDQGVWKFFVLQINTGMILIGLRNTSLPAPCRAVPLSAPVPDLEKENNVC